MQPFWSAGLTAITKKVWRPTQGESEVVLKVNYSPAWKKLTSNTWFATTLQQPAANSPSLGDDWKKAKVPLPAIPTNKRKKGGRTRGGSTAKKKKPPELQAAKIMKIKAYPTTEQKDILRQWIGTCRWTYNQCVAFGKQHPTTTTTTTIKDLRTNFLNKAVLEEKGFDWALKVPYDVRDEAARDFMKAVESNKAKQKEKPDHHFEVGFRSRKKSHQETLNILGKHTRWDPAMPDSLFFFTFAFSSPLQLAESLPVEYFEERSKKGGLCCLYDLRLTREKTGDWFLCLPLPLSHEYLRTAPLSNYHNPAPADPKERRKVVALDPGVRTFITGYSPDGDLFEICPGDSTKLLPIAEKVDQLQSRWGKDKGTKAKKRRRMRKRAHKLRRRLHHLTTEMHRKTAKLLVASYDTILIPTFEVSQMVEKDDRVINSQTVRNMLNWRHYAFRQLLIAKAREVPGVKVLEVGEAYTSKCCGACGKIHPNLGGNKIFRCPTCHFTLDRDANGARNIFLRNMGLAI